MPVFSVSVPGAHRYTAHAMEVPSFEEKLEKDAVMPTDWFQYTAPVVRRGVYPKLMTGALGPASTQSTSVTNR